ncbi:MAG: heme exporter protein D [Motiliproteus sp.]|jgi:heme exporter protein D
MYFDTFSDFIAMGGHGLYVWLAYAIALIIIVFNVLSPLLAKKQFMAAYKRRLRREQRSNETPIKESTQ